MTMGNMRSTVVAAVMGLLAVGLGAGNVQAGYNAVLVGGTPTFDSLANDHVYIYNVTTTGPLEQVSAQSADFIRFYDFNGYVAGSAQGPSSDWQVIDTVKLDVPPLGVNILHGDDAAITNITFQYVGAPPVTGDLGSFTIRSTDALGTSFKDFYGLSTNTGTTPPTGIDTRLDYMAPSLTLQSVPEPTALISAGIGAVIVGLGFARRALRRAAETKPAS
jgi:hypothetical protein